MVSAPMTVTRSRRLSLKAQSLAMQELVRRMLDDGIHEATMRIVEQQDGSVSVFIYPER